MAQATPGSNYNVQQGDTLPKLAQQAYGDDSLWHEIYIANSLVIGNDPNVLAQGTTLFIPHNLLVPQLCTITSASGLNVRAAPTTHSALIAKYPPGTVLNFVQIVNGENINGNPLWGRSRQGHYFWLGGTSRPNG